MLQKQHVEISKATAAFTVQVRNPLPPAAGGRGAAAPQARRFGGARGVAAALPTRRRSPKPRSRAPLEPRDVPGRQLHHPHGSAVLAHRGRAARLPVLGAERSAEESVRRHRLDVPGRLRVQAVRVTDVKVLDVPVERVSGPVRAPGGVSGQGGVFAINAQRRQRAAHAALPAAQRGLPGRGGAVRSGRAEVRTRVVRRQQRRGGRSRESGGRAGREGDRDRRRAHGQDASGAGGSRRADAHVAEHADRGLVAARARRRRPAVRLHQRPGRGEGREPAREVRRDHVRAGWRRRARRHRGAADVPQPDAVEELAGDAEHRHLRADRRHPPGPRLGRPQESRDVRARRRRLHRQRIERDVRRPVRLDARRDDQHAGHGLARRRVAPADEGRRRHEPARLRRAGQPRRLQRQRRQLSASVPAAAEAAGVAAAPPASVQPAAARRTIRTSRKGGRRSTRGSKPRSRPTVSPWQYALPTEEQLTTIR